MKPSQEAAIAKDSQEGSSARSKRQIQMMIDSLLGFSAQNAIPWILGH